MSSDSVFIDYLSEVANSHAEISHPLAEMINSLAKIIYSYVEIIDLQGIYDFCMGKAIFEWLSFSSSWLSVVTDRDRLLFHQY